MAWLVLMPFWLAAAILLIPLALLAIPVLLILPILSVVWFSLRFVVRLVAGVALLPIVLLLAVVAVVVGVALSFAVLAPLLPLIFVVLCIWALARLVFALRVRTSA
jgi:hypothetical protein